MAEFLSPGVFIEEVASGESAILGVSTSNFATIGWTPRGEENKAILVTSLQDYFRKFGQFWSNSDVPIAVTAFFKNQGARAFFVRVSPDDAVAASGAFGSSWDVDGISRGAWGNNVRIKIVGNDNFYDYPTATYSRFDFEVQEESADGAADFAATESFEAVVLDDTESADYFPEVINDDDNGSGTVRISDGASPGIPPQFISTEVLGEVVGSGDTSTTLFTKTLVSAPVAPFTLQVKLDGVTEVKDDGRGRLILADTSVSSTGVSGTIDYATGDLAIDFVPAPGGSVAITADYYSAGVSELVIDLTGGLDGTAISRAQISDPALEIDNKGIFAFNLVEEILNIGIPDFRGDPIVHGDLLDYCENRRDCFAILDTPKGVDAQSAKNYKQVTLGRLSEYGAIYFPGVQVADPLKNGRLKVVSAVGHIAGVYARTDNNRNVGKAPAGVNEGQLSYTVKLEQVLSKGERDFVYPANINPLISSTATGRAVWGARTLAITGDFTLVNVRRLFIFLEKSIFNATHDLVFEPIGDDLFATVKLRLDGFLGNLTNEGFFGSRVPEEAFRTVVDDSNNTTASKNARQLIADVFISPQIPAEFVRFRFQRLLETT